jgi:hypothetical protein
MAPYHPAGQTHQQTGEAAIQLDHPTTAVNGNDFANDGLGHDGGVLHRHPITSCHHTVVPMNAGSANHPMSHERSVPFKQDEFSGQGVFHRKRSHHKTIPRPDPRQHAATGHGRTELKSILDQSSGDGRQPTGHT